MLILPIASSLLLLGLIVFVLLRARRYIRQHPELMTNATPLAYQRCQVTLAQVIERYQQVQVDVQTTVVWHAPNGWQYTLTGKGIEQRHESAGEHYLGWPEIGGVGVRMQPGFKFVDNNRDGSPEQQFTTGYSFHLLIVPISGSTMTIPVPTNQRTDAVNFVAHTIALAEKLQKRINVFGFNKPPAPHRRRVKRY